MLEIGLHRWGAHRLGQMPQVGEMHPLHRTRSPLGMAERLGLDGSPRVDCHPKQGCRGKERAVNGLEGMGSEDGSATGRPASWAIRGRRWFVWLLVMLQVRGFAGLCEVRRGPGRARDSEGG